jgi:hypothetical protein
LLTATCTRNSQQEVITNIYYDSNAAPGNVGRLKEVRGPGNELLASLEYDVAGRIRMQSGVDGFVTVNGVQSPKK